MKQKFIKEVKGHFNLRKPKGSKPTDVFFVVRLDGKQYKLSSGMKVYPDQWDSKGQQAIESNMLSKLDNRNNKLVNEKINTIKSDFMDFLQYLCTSLEEPQDLIEILREYIYKNMNKRSKTNKKNVDVESIINKAFEYYYTYISQVKKSSYAQNETRLKLFTTYIQKKNLNNNIEVFSQAGFNAYKAYLTDKVNSDEEFGISRLNDALQLIARLINKVLAVEDDYLQYKIGTVNFVKMQDKRTQEDICRFPLYDDEIQAVIDCDTLTEKEQEYRTVFLLQCECGLRVSDLQTLMNGEGEQENDIISVLTKKEEDKGLYAQVHITPKLEQYLFKEVPNFKLINIKKFNEGEYNKTIKAICEKAGLERIISWKDSKGKKQKSKLYEVVVNHCFRHTFITNKVKEGVPYDVLCLMTGHADDRMIKEVYANLTKEDKRDKVSKYYGGQVENKESSTPHRTANVIDAVFGYDKLMQLQDLQKNGTDLRNLPLTKDCIQIVLSTANLNKAIDYSKGKDLTQLKEKALELYGIIRALTIMQYNPNIYHIYEYKLFKFGFIEDMLPMDMIEDMFREPTEDEIAEAQLEEHLKHLSRLNNKMEEGNDTSD